MVGGLEGGSGGNRVDFASSQEIAASEVGGGRAANLWAGGQQQQGQDVVWMMNTLVRKKVFRCSVDCERNVVSCAVEDNGNEHKQEHVEETHA